MDVTNDSIADVDTTVWYNWQQAAVPMLLDLTFEACTKPFRSRFGVPFFTSILWYRTNQDRTEASWLLRHDEGIALGRLLCDMLSVPSAADSVEREFDRACRRLLELCAKTQSNDESTGRAANDQLVAVNAAFLDFYSVGAITEPIQFYCESMVTSWQKTDEAKDFEADLGLSAASILSALTSSSEEMYSSAIQRELLRMALAEEAPSGVPSAEEHARSYPWKSNNYARARSVTTAEVEAEISNLRKADPAQELKKLSDSHQTTAMLRARVLQAAPERIRTLSLLAERFGTIMADRRKQVMLQALAALDLLVRAVAAGARLPAEAVAMLSPDEVAGITSNGLSDLADRATQRMESYVQVLAPWPLDDAEMSALLSRSSTSGSWRIPTSDEAAVFEGKSGLAALRDLDRRMGIFTSARDADAVYGSLVRVDGLQDQVIKAPCRIVLDPVRDGPAFNEGDILIATSTTPDFVPLMMRASAIVTNTGGMFQHAAHFAREHKLPCVIGCGSATAAFQSGDVVILDTAAASLRRDAQT